MIQGTVRGYLIVDVEEGSGKTQQGSEFTWETAAGSTFEAFVKVEIRGGPQNVKAQTRKAALVGETITWGEQLRLEVLEGSNELRLMMCREKFLGTKRGTSVIAACGIFVSDILEAVPIDKYFELFKPNNGGEGGMIRVSMKFVKTLEELDAADASDREAALMELETSSQDASGLAGFSEGTVSEVTKRIAAMDAEGSVNKKKKSRKGRGLLVLMSVAAAAVGTALVLGKRK